LRRGRRARRGRACGVDHRALDLLLRAFQLPFDLADGIEIRIALRLARHLVDLLLEVGHLRLAHRFLKLVLELGGHAAQLAHPLPERAQHGRQLLRPDRDQRDDADEQELAPTDLEHGGFNSERRAMRRRPSDPRAAGLSPRRAAAQPALRVSVTVAVGAGAGWWSIVFGSVLTGSVSAFSSSVSPFLNDLIPLAKSPISSEI